MVVFGGSIRSCSIRLILLLLVFCCASCTIPHRLAINSEREDYILLGECGAIRIESRTLGGLLTTFINFTFNGEYHINTDYFTLEMEQRFDEVMFENLRFRFNGEDFTRKERETKGGDVLSIRFNLKTAAGTMLIVPSNFITCGGNPVVADTIRIQLLN